MMEKIKLFKTNHGEINSLAVYFHVGRNRIVIACSFEDKTLAEYTLEGSSIIPAWERSMGSRAWYTKVSIAPEGPAYFSGREDGHFHTYAIDGTPKWSHDFSAAISDFLVYKDPFSGEKMLLIPSIDKTLRLLNASDGSLVWGDTFQSGVNIASELMLENGNEHVLCAGGNDSTLRCYTRAAAMPENTYKMSWFHKFDSYVRDVDISSEGKVVAVADDGFLKIFDLQTGNVEWKYEHGSFAWKCKIIEELNMVLSTSYQVPIQVDDGEDLLGNPGIIACNELTTGNITWKSTPGDGWNINAWDVQKVGDEWIILAGTTSGNLLVIDAREGKLIHSENLDTLINQVFLVENQV